MQHNDDRPVKRRRSRTKQTLQGPRHIDLTVAEKLKAMVWVTIGKTEHQAWLLEDVKDKNMVSIRWESTGAEQTVPVLSIRHEAPDDGRRSRRIRTPVQDPYRNLNDTSIQVSRKKKKRQTNNHKAATESKKEIEQPHQLEGDGSVTLEAKVESQRLTNGLSAMKDIGGDLSMGTFMPEQGVLPEGKVNVDNNYIRKASFSDAAKAKASEFSEIWESAKRAALSTYADQSATSTIAKGAKNSKAGKSISKAAASNKKTQSKKKYI